MRKPRLARILLLVLTLAPGVTLDAAGGWAAPSPARLFLPALLRQSDLAESPSALPPRRRINAPLFETAVDPAQAAVLWFGQVDPTTDYADVRLAYTAT